MKPFSIVMLAAVVAGAVSFATVRFVGTATSTTVLLKNEVPTALPSITVGAAAENAFERVMQANTIRCGYYSWAPFMVKDANTGKFSGIFYDMFNEIADNAGLKVEWAEEIGLGEFPEALKSGRIDAYCTPLAQLGTRARAVDFTDAVGYFPVYAFVRPNDKRFDGDLAKINDAAVKISTIDGEISALQAMKLFPKAQTVQLPQNAPVADLLNNVATGKADVAINEYSTVNKFLESNPGKLAAVTGTGPVGVFGGGFALPQGEDKLRQMLNWSLKELMFTGRIESIYRNNGIAPTTILPPGNPYKE